MDAFTLLLMLLGLGSGATTCDEGDPERGTRPVGG